MTLKSPGSVVTPRRPLCHNCRERKHFQRTLGKSAYDGQ